jgi:general secretion pathway protein C
MNINFSNLLKTFIPFLVIILLTYSINIILYIYLPKSYNFTPESKDYKVKYIKYNIAKSLKEKKVKKVRVKPKKVVVKKKKEYKLISNIILKAIYAEANNNGWIIISEKRSKSKTEILGIGDNFKNFILESVFPTYVVFSKGEKEYKLSLIKDKKVEFTIKEKAKTVKNKNKKVNKPLLVDIEAEDETSINIKRTFLNQYIQYPSKIWKDISIKEIKKNGQIDGFKINRLSNNSVFKRLGLKRGDIIKSINNIELDSYSKAINLYKNIGELENLIFLIIRDNQELELEYEIK